MAKTNRGGKRSTPNLTSSQLFQMVWGVNSASDDQTNTPPTPPPKQVVISKFREMTDDDKASQISASIKGGSPVHLAQNDFQKFLYNTKLNDKPQVVSDAQFNQIAGTPLYRTVNQVYDRVNDISYTAPQIANQLMNGTYTRVSDTGGSVYGRGLYFADNHGDSATYGRNRNDVQKTAMIYAKLNPNAKVISYNSAQQGLANEIKSGTKLGQSLKNVSNADAVSLYALSKGYAVIKSGTYLNVVDRSALIINENVKSIQKRGVIMKKENKQQSVNVSRLGAKNIDAYFEKMSKGTANRMTGTGTGLDKKKRK